MKSIHLFFLIAAMTVSGNGFASEVLEMIASPVWKKAEASCNVSPKGGLMSPGNLSPPCALNIPIPLSGAHTIKQVVLYYGLATSGATNIAAEVRYKDLLAGTDPASLDHATGLAWSHAESGGSTSAIFSGNLMAQSGTYPYPALYPDAFSIDAGKAYYIDVTLGQLAIAEFLGVRVIYD